MDHSLELLLVASESKDPFPAVIVNPKNCVSCWAYKGNELQGGEIGCVEPVGQKGDLLFIADKERPLTHILAVHGRDRFHVKSVLTKPLRCVAVSKDGAVIFGSIDSKIFVWLVSTGELLTTANAHYQEIKCLCLSSDDGLLISGAADGAINVYLVSDLMSLRPGGLEVLKPFREWRVHSLEVTGLSSTCLANARILSCSKDHTAAIHSVVMDECLLKISGDRPISASCFDPAETCVFLGTDEGPIVQFHLYSIEGISEKMLTIGEKSHEDGLFFLGHTFQITRITVNHDASLLASGDCSGCYRIWDTVSHQCLNCVQKKGSICKLLFILPWDSLRESDYPKISLPVGVLQRSQITSDPKKLNLCAVNPVDTPDTKAFVRDHLSKCFEKQIELFHVLSGSEKDFFIDEADINMHDADAVIDEEIPATNEPTTFIDHSLEADNIELKIRNANLFDEVKKLQTEVAVLKKKNCEIFGFATNLVLEKRKKK